MKVLYTALLLFGLSLSHNASSTHYTLLTTIDTSSKDEVISAISEGDEPLFGIASFYKNTFEGASTATGETFLQRKLTAASNFFKLNSWVRVTNVHNGKSVVVRINDRMHPRMAKKGRVVDLTLTGAKKIGLTALAGITKVKVELVDR